MQDDKVFTQKECLDREFNAWLQGRIDILEMMVLSPNNSVELLEKLVADAKKAFKEVE